MKILKNKKIARKFSGLNIFGKKENIGHSEFSNILPFEISEVALSDRKITTSRLKNGVTVVSETPDIPKDVTISLLLNVGTRDEVPRNSGALHSILTTYYKSFVNTNETINYGMVQMSGGRYNMNFNRENTCFKMSCLSHDVVDIFSMMTDCAIEPRNFNSVGVAQEKLGNSHAYRKISNNHLEFTNVVFRAVWGNLGLGMPLWGNPNNTNSLDSYTMQQFQLENITPEGIVVCGLGVENHGELEELVDQKLGKLYYNNNKAPRQKSVFQENDVRMPSQSGKSQFAVLFEAPSISSENLLAYYLLSELLGSVEVNQFDPLELKNSHLNDLYKKHSFVHALEAKNFHFSDSGMFSLRGVVSGNNLNSALEAVANVFNASKKVKKADFERARKSLGLKLLSNLENDYLRAEELVKEQSVWGNVKADKVLNELNNLSIEQFVKVVSALGNAKMSFVVETPNLSNIHSYEKIKSLFK